MGYSNMATSRGQYGFTLIEMLFVIAITVIIFGALFVSFNYTLELIANSRAQTSALSLANDRMEYFRSLPYDDVGTVSGIPAGSIPQHSTTTLNNMVFTERVLVEYVDDPADGLLTATTTDSNGIPSDYKRIKIEISWSVYDVPDSLILVSNIVPRSIETTDGGGTVRINVIDADSNPLPGAEVTLLNNTTTTTIDVTKISDSSGTALFSGAPAGSNYEVVVTAPGYSTDQTYVATTSNPTPTTAPFSVLEADISTLTFQIDELSDISLTAYSSITDGRRDEWFDDATGIASSSDIVVGGGVLRLENVAAVYDTAGSAYLTTLTPSPLEEWEALTFATNVPANTDIVVKLYTLSSTTYALIPDADLPGNGAGFRGPIVDLSNLSVVTYPSIVVGVHLSTSNTAITPTVDAVELFYRESSTPRAGMVFSARGAKVIGSDASAQPIYKTSLGGTTDGSGELDFSDVEFDTYETTFPGSLTVSRSCPTFPLNHQAGITSVVEVLLTGSVANSLLVTTVSSDGTPIPGTLVDVSQASFSGTGRTNSCGQLFFGGGVVVAPDYHIEVSKSGFNSETIDPYDLNGNSQVTVILDED